MVIDRGLAEKAVGKVAEALGLPLKQAAEGIINIVNENMFGALRLVSVEQGFDPRDFSLIGFGGAGPLHANALGRLTGAWPVIIPPGPGVLCAYGDATTRIRDEASQTFIRRIDETSDAEVLGMLEELSETAARSLDEEGIPRHEQSTGVEIDMRYSGQGMQLSINMDMDDFTSGGLRQISKTFDDMHTQLFTFALDAPHELVNLRTIVQGTETLVKAETIASGGDVQHAVIETTTVFVDGQDREAKIYDRSKLASGNSITGPAIVTEMDSTTLILPDHVGEVDHAGNILVRPTK